MEFTHRERFHGFSRGGQTFAPMSLGTAALTNYIDYKTFEKTKEEKDLVALIKRQHKQELIKCYGAGNTRNHMNPSVSAEVVAS